MPEINAKEIMSILQNDKKLYEFYLENESFRTAIEILKKNPSTKQIVDLVFILINNKKTSTN